MRFWRRKKDQGLAMEGRPWCYSIGVYDGYRFTIHPPAYGDWNSAMIKGTLPEMVGLYVDGLIYASAPLAWWEWLAMEQGYKRPLLGGVVVPLPRERAASSYTLELDYNRAGSTTVILCRRPTDARPT